MQHKKNIRRAQRFTLIIPQKVINEHYSPVSNPDLILQKILILK